MKYEDINKLEKDIHKLLLAISNNNDLKNKDLIEISGLKEENLINLIEQLIEHKLITTIDKQNGISRNTFNQESWGIIYNPHYTITEDGKNFLKKSD